MATKPDKIPFWAEEADPENVEEPPSSIVKAGFDKFDTIPRQWLQWRWREVGRWIEWLESRVLDAVQWATKTDAENKDAEDLAMDPKRTVYSIEKFGVRNNSEDKKATMTYVQPGGLLLYSSGVSFQYEGEPSLGFQYPSDATTFDVAKSDWEQNGRTSTVFHHGVMSLRDTFEAIDLVGETGVTDTLVYFYSGYPLGEGTSLGSASHRVNWRRLPGGFIEMWGTVKAYKPTPTSSSDHYIARILGTQLPAQVSFINREPKINVSMTYADDWPSSGPSGNTSTYINVDPSNTEIVLLKDGYNQNVDIDMHWSITGKEV